MNKSLLPFWSLILVAVLVSGGCKDKTPKVIDYVFSPDEDVTLGLQLHNEILENPDEYPLLDETEYAEAYSYLQGMCDKLVSTGKLDYADDFDYKVYIIDADVLNAFAAPGGKLYFYTGLIKYLDEEDDVMGVMGHEIAHADRRHSVKQMLENYGAQYLISVALGDNPSGVKQVLGMIAGQGAALKFSRTHESEADEFSVIYLSETEYRCDGASAFFQKLSDSGQAGGTPEFLSTHPDPENRIEDIQAKAAELGCDTAYLAPPSFYEFKAMLP